MKKGIVTYRSKYGSTKKYAQWLAEEMNFDLIESKGVKIDQLIKYDVIVHMGGLYASSVAGFSFFKKNFEHFADKKLALFCVGASPYSEEIIEAIKEHHFSDKMHDVAIYYGRGAWNYDKMTFRDKILCKLLHKAVANKDPKDYELWESALMEAFGQDSDWTDRDYLEPLISFIKK